MKVVVLTALGPENLKLVERPEPRPAHGEVLVRLTAASLNYRDLVVVGGGYGSHQRTSDLVPLSDGAGEVTAVGEGVRRFKPGDRVASTFFEDWVAGEPTQEKLDSALGALVDGVLAEYRVFPERALVSAPEHLSDAEAATLPCAALTAWSALISQGGLSPGESVLVLGTGGVSLFALQFAKLAGAQVIATSSSDEKLEKVKALGADHVINYETTPDWGKRAVAITGGRGVDHVVEVGGAGTLQQSLRAVRAGGRVYLIGVLSGAKHELMLPYILTRNVRVQGVTVGSREQFEAMLRAITAAEIRPVIDRRFPMAEIAEAFDYLKAGRHFGKVVIEI